MAADLRHYAMLIDGEWVEIEDGLKGDELVVVDIASGDVASAA